jgi:AraC family transcriptional regulator
MSPQFVTGHFPGKVLGSREVSGFLFTETGYLPNQRIPYHTHERANFIIVLRGTFTECLGTKTRTCAPRWIIFRPPGELHRDHFHHAGGRCLTIEVPATWGDRSAGHSLNLEESADFQNGVLTTITARLYSEFRRVDNSSSLALEGLTLEMIAEASRVNNGSRSLTCPSRLRRAREIIHANFTNNLTLNFIAESIGAHPVWLAREFRRRYHCTIGEYVRQLRLELACHQIANSEATLAQIASACGFFDQSHFSRTFKRLTGTTPAKFRRNIHSH